jgi:ABC-type transporter lipoprotein component MlaA
MFVVVMAIFGFLGVFDEATQVVAALSSAFAVIGTFVGAYFGVKASSEARDTVEKVQRETAGPMREVAQQATNAAASAEKAAHKVATATDQASPVVVPPVAPPNGDPSE